MHKHIFLLGVLSVLLAAPVHGAALGVNKASMDFNDVLNGGYAQDTVTITTDTDFNISLEHEARGDVADWIRLEPNNESDLIFSSQNPLRLRVIVEPPEDIANGVYTGTLRLLTGTISRAEGQYGSTVRASFGVKLQVEITGEQIQTCTVGGFVMPDTERDYPLELQATLQNTGNVRVQPTFNINIWNQAQTEVVASREVSEESEILPTTQERLVNTFNQSLPIGQYWATIDVPECEDSGKVTFSVLELGGVSDRGELLRIDNEPWAGTDDIVRIGAVFKNLGRRTVNAKFTGTIELDDRVVEVIETDSLNVPPGRTETLESFFNPQAPGRYEVKGRVNYNNKLTFQKSSMINVRGEVAPRVTGNVISRIMDNPYQLGMVFIGIMIIGLLFLIGKERRKRY